MAGYLGIGLSVSIEQVLHNQYIESLGVASLGVFESDAVGTDYLGQSQGSLYGHDSIKQHSFSSPPSLTHKHATFTFYPTHNIIPRPTAYEKC